MGSQALSFQKTTSSHGSYAQQRKRHQPPLASVQAHSSVLGETVGGRHRERNLLYGEEGLLPFVHRRGAQGFPWHTPSEDDRWQQDCAHSPCSRTRPYAPRGPPLPD